MIIIEIARAYQCSCSCLHLLRQGIGHCASSALKMCHWGRAFPCTTIVAVLVVGRMACVIFGFAFFLPKIHQKNHNRSAKCTLSKEM